MFKTLWFGKALLLQCQLLHAVLHVQGVWLGWSKSIRGKVTHNSIVSLYGQSSLEVWCGHLEMYCQQIKLAWWKAWNLIEDIHHTLIASTYSSGSICVPVHSFPLHSEHVMEDHRAGSSEAHIHQVYRKELVLTMQQLLKSGGEFDERRPRKAGKASRWTYECLFFWLRESVLPPKPFLEVGVAIK